jgi:hypothetical protein
MPVAVAQEKRAADAIVGAATRLRDQPVPRGFYRIG